MKLSGVFVRAGLVGLAGLTLSGCGQYGLKGDRGLPPSPEGLAYPSVYSEPGMDPHRPLKSPADQKKIQADLEAHKPQRRVRN